MRFQLSVLAVAALQAFAASKVDLEVKASFGERNPFAQIVNGQSNALFLSLQNMGNTDLTVQSVSGSFHDKTAKGKLRHLKNSTLAKYNLNLPSSATQPVRLTYNFHSEFKPRELGLTVWVDFVDTAKKTYREVAYEGQVTVVEPPGSWFDPALLFAYAIMLALFGLVGVTVYNSYVADGKKNRINLLGKQKSASARVGTPTVQTPTSADNEDWIPSHHSKKKSSAASDGEGTDTGYSSSGAAKNRRATNKGKQKAN